MQVPNRAVTPSQVGPARSLNPGTGPLPSLPQSPLRLETLERRVQDSLSPGQKLPAAAMAPTSELGQTLQGLRVLSGSGNGSNAQGLGELLQRFRSETLPRNLERLNNGLAGLSQQLAALAPDAPERAGLELQQRVLQETLDLYRQAETLLAQAAGSAQASPALAPAPKDTDATLTKVAGAAVPAVSLFDETSVSPTAAVSAATPAGPAEAPPTEASPGPKLSTLAADGVVPRRRNSNFADLDRLLGDGPPERGHFFEKRQRLLKGHSETLGSEIAQLRAAGGDAAELGRVERTRALTLSLATLYGEIGGYDGTGKAGIETDVRALNSRILAATEALTASAGDLSPKTVERLQSQLGDFTTLAASFLQMKGEGRPEHNLGRFFARSYKRLGEIQVGDRRRANEPATIAGALQTYANDHTDMATFLQRFAALRGRIRSGLGGAEARAAALASIPGTSKAFQDSFLNLVGAEVALESARKSRAAAQAAIGEADGQVSSARGQIAAGNAELPRGQQATRAGRDASSREHFGAARQLNGQATEAHLRASGSFAAAGGSLDRAGAARDRAAGQLSSARGQRADAERRLSAVAGGAYARELSRPVSEARAVSAQVGGEIAATQGSLTRLDGDIAATRADLALSEHANQQLGQDIGVTAQQIEAGEAEQRRRQAEQNKAQLDQLDRLLLIDSGKFKLELVVGIKAGIGNESFGASGSANLTASLNGEKGVDGSYTLDVRFGGEISGKVNAWLFEVEGRARFESLNGIKLTSREQVQELSRLLNEVTGALSEHGLTSDEAAAARDAFLNFLHATRRTGNIQTYETTARYGTGDAQRSGKVKVTVENHESHNFDDSNVNGQQDAGEAANVSRTRAVKAETQVEIRGRQYGVNGRVTRNEDGSVKSLQFGITLPNGSTLGRNVLAHVGPALASAGIPTDSLNTALVAQALQRLPAETSRLSPKAELTLHVLEHDGKQQVFLGVLNKTSGEMRQEIPLTGIASVTVQARAELETQKLVPVA